MSDKDYEKYLYLISRLIRLYNIILKYHKDFTDEQLNQVNIYASMMDVWCHHMREKFMPEHYNVDNFEKKVIEYEDLVVKSFQWYDLTWKNQKPLL